jgi:hypothetical protein
VTRTDRLPLGCPAAVAGAREGIWIGDAASKSAVLFDAGSTSIVRRIALSHAPIGIATTKELVAVALENGDVVTFGAGELEPRWRRTAGSGDLELKASRDHVWAWDKTASVFLMWDVAGEPERFDATGATAFAPVDTGVYWLSSAGVVAFDARAGTSRKASLPDHALPAGAVLACANSLWISIAGGLLLASLDTLGSRATLSAPEGPVPHLVCFHGRVFGGGVRAVFAIEPAADDNARSLGVTLRHPLLGLGVVGTHLWAVETGEPVVHIVRLP